MTGPSLFLVTGSTAVPIGDRARAIGRLPERDVTLDGWEVSRRRARIVPTTAGPVPVDRSRFGTFVHHLGGWPPVAHWRRAARSRPLADANRLRPTSARELPGGQLASFRIHAEAEAADRPALPPRISTGR